MYSILGRCVLTPDIFDILDAIPTDHVGGNGEKISAFQNQYITLRFVTYDVGDSVYDTAALIDCVALN